MRIFEKDIQCFAAYLQSEEKSTATVEKYSREVRRFSAWLGERELVRDLALAYKAELAQSRAPAGVNGAVAALNRFFVFLGLPECRVKALRVQRQIFRDEARELTYGEYRRLLAAAKKRRNERLMLVMEAICSTGIRVSELRFFTVEAAAAGRAQVANKGKIRTVLLPRKLQRALLDYARRRKITDGPLFATRSGRPLDRSNIWHDMKALCRDANVAEAKVFPHNLRHLFARTYYSLEKDIVRLADILGHSSVDTTRIYTMESGYTHQQHLEQLGLVV